MGCGEADPLRSPDHRCQTVDVSGSLFFTLDATLRSDVPAPLADWLEAVSSGSGTTERPPGVSGIALEMSEASAWLLGLREIEVTRENQRPLRVAGHVRLRDDGFENQAIYGLSFLVAPFVEHDIIGVTWSTWTSEPSNFSMIECGQNFGRLIR